MQKPKVKLIQIADIRESAWRFSRPGFDHSDIDMDQIGSMDMSLNSLCTVTFEVHSSLIFRDWLFSIRPIFPWARSSRSAPLTEVNAQISAEFGKVGRKRVKAVLKAIDDGVPQDQAREGLPMTMGTAFTVSMDLRTCIGMIKTMEEMDTFMYDTYGRKFAEAIKNIPGVANSTVKAFTEEYLLNDTEGTAEGSTSFGGQMFGFYDMKAALMAQFLRMSHAKVKTGIWNLINQKGYRYLGNYRQSDSFKVAYYCDIASYRKLMRLRSHWFADWSSDMWGKMVGDFCEDMTDEEFWDFIPNGNGRVDPYYRDMISRITGEEHNLPCPIMTENPEFVSYRLEEQGDNPIIQRYIKLVEGGFIKDNPENEMRKAYETRIENQQSSK